MTVFLRRRWWWPLALLGALMLTVMGTPLVSWWAQQLAGPWEDPRGEVLIVLAGALHSREADGAPIIGHNSYMRAVYALRVWRAGGFRKILITGDAATAPAMETFLSAAGVPHQALLLEAQSNSTHDHPARCRPILDQNPGRVVLLTSDYHMWRARAVFRHAGIEVQPRPIPDVLKSVSSSHIWRWQGFLTLLEESGKIVYYRYQGWI